jgi:tetratricopeptide (TPR) repeat protein
MEQRRFAEAVETFGHALKRSDGGPLQTDLEQARQRAVRAQAIDALHRRVERSRYLHGDELLAPDTLRALEALCRVAWDERERLIDAAAGPLDAETEENLRRDLLDVAVLWADCRVRLATPATADAARREALQTLHEAETLFGPGPVLSRQRQALTQPTAPPAGPEPAPRTAWEHYALGRWLFRTGDLTAAAAAFDRAVALRPQDFWPWFGKGLCAHRRGHDAEAVTAFSVCIALGPDNAACYFNRALALAACGDSAAALADYDRALQLDPRLAAAALNRGVLHLQERRLGDAESDFALALKLGGNPAAVHYNLALLHQARLEPAAAVSSLERALACDPGHAPSRELLGRLRKQLPSNGEAPR